MRVRINLLVVLMAGFALGISAARASDTFEVDRSHSSVGFKVRHLVSNVTGRFGDFSGTVMLDLTDPSRSSVAFKIKAASIDTQEPKRDGHLKSPDFFEVEKFPEWTFASTKIVKAQGNAYDVTGSFAMHGVTREITIPVELLGTAKDPWGNERAGFSSSFSLNRKEYGIVWNKILDAGGTLLGDEVTVSINLEAIKAKPAAPPAGK